MRYDIVVELQNKASRGLKSVEDGLGRVEKKANNVKSSLTKVGAALAAVGAAAIVKGITNQYLAYEKYQSVLKTFLGSQQKANSELDRLNKIAGSLPQTLDDVTEAFTILSRNGIDTSNASLTAFANIAAGSGKSMVQLAEAVADGMTGEFERFKEFGVKVTKEGDKLTARLGEQVVGVSNSAAELTRNLSALGQEGGFFAGAAGNFAGTLTLAFSNLEGAVFNLSIALGKAFSPVVIPAIEAISAGITTLAENMGRVISYAGTAAVLLSGKFAVAMGVVAVRATMAFVASLVATRAALMRTGIGVLIVGMGELVYQASKAIESMGGFGATLEAIGKMGKMVIDNLSNMWAGFTTYMGGVGQELGGTFQFLWGGIQLGAENLINTLAESFFKLRKMINENVVNPIIDSVNAMIEAFNKLPDTIITDIKLINKTEDSGQYKPFDFGSAGNIDAGMAGILGGRGEQSKGADMMGDTVTAVWEGWKGITKESQNAAAALVKLNDPLATAMESTKEIVNTLGGGEGATVSLPAVIDQATAKASELETEMKNVSTGIVDGLTSALSDGEVSFNEFRNIALDAIGDIAKSWLNNSSMFKAGGGMFAGTGGILSTLGSFAGFFDKGGNIGSGQFGIAGENGPELIKGPANVTSTKDSAALFGGGGGGGDVYAPVFNTTINPGSDTSPEQAKAFADSFNSTIEAKVSDTLIKLQNKRGAFAQARPY